MGLISRYFNRYVGVRHEILDYWDITGSITFIHLNEESTIRNGLKKRQSRRLQMERTGKVILAFGVCQVTIQYIKQLQNHALYFSL